MAFDYFVFKRLIELIKNKVENGKIVKISQISNEEFLFTIRKDNENNHLLISTHPNMSYINIVDNKPLSNHVTSNILMLFRKHLENGTISSISQENDDRIALFMIANRDDYYRNTIHKLYVELIGRASNMILTNQDNVIIDSLKKIPLEYLNLRTIQPGIKYVLPDKPLNSSLPYDIENELNYRNISLEKLMDEIAKSSQIYIVKNGKKSNFHFIPFTFIKGEITSYSWNEGLEKYYDSSLKNERHRQVVANLEKFVNRELKKCKSKIEKLQIELLNAKSANIYKYYGDLLLTYMQGKKIYDDVVCVLDEEKNEEVRIPFDRKYNVYANASMYYKKYQKSKVATVKIGEQIQILSDQIEYFNTLHFQLINADAIIVSQINEELEEQGYFRKIKTQNKKNKTGKKKVYRPLAIKYHDTMIYVGLNNLQNEYLTFSMAKKTHMFFHIQQGPGSHVVVFSDNITDDIKMMAANIAAYYSSYKDSSTVAVNYTLIKNIKKIPGGKPGKVIINNQKTVYVDPDYLLFKDFILD
ncbi:MAG: NFACT family protein [Erysipelotrichaceae bacterium]|nr:NFACT family protein [Erysipelotrichaceae bacterium]